MLLALDVHYRSDAVVSVGVLFADWKASEPLQTIKVMNPPDMADYEAGQFYKRELPYLLQLIEKIDLEKIDCIIVDGYVQLDDAGRLGLGGHLSEKIKHKVPIVGVAKNSFTHIDKSCIEVYRGISKKPLYVTSVGIDLALAAQCVQEMDGTFRFPTLLKLLDVETKN